MVKVTQNSKADVAAGISGKSRIYLALLTASLVLYTPAILNANIEQEVQNMSQIRTTQEAEFLSYFRRINKHAIGKIISQYRSTGPAGYAGSLVLARILKVKERISSDRELSEKPNKIKIYREAIGISRHDIPAHNTFNTLRHRLGPEGFARIHQYFVLNAHKTGLLIPPIPHLPKMVRDKIILVGDSTFLKAVASTKGEKIRRSRFFRLDSVSVATNEFVVLRVQGEMFRPGGVWWIVGEKFVFKVDDRCIALEKVRNAFGFFLPTTRTAQVAFSASRQSELSRVDMK